LAREACKGLKIEYGEAKCYILVEEIAYLQRITYQLRREMKDSIHNKQIQHAKNIKCFSICAKDAQHTITICAILL
jgi:hypothetical protein